MFSKSFLEKLDVINQFQMERPMAWYRGHSNHNYRLLSGLFRMKFRKLDDFIHTEQSYYNMYLTYGYSLHKTSDWELLHIMQHHGVKTRLLDWTESFAVSLYFASLNWNPYETDCTVWLLDPIMLNEKFIPGFGLYIPKPHESYQNLLYEHGEPFEFNFNSIALFPKRNNPRLIAQQGTFTLQGNTTLSLDQEYNGSFLEEKVLQRVDFSIEDHSDIRNYLQLNGINQFSLFPDLEGLAKFITTEDTEYITQASQDAPDIT